MKMDGSTTYSAQAPAASARPDIISLDVLLTEVDEGRVQVPRFQRPYVWTPQMMRELFESVLSGYPIGSLLFWTARDLEVATMNVIGPLPAPKRTKNSAVSLVLDGHQRLATLYGVLRLPETFPKHESVPADKLGWWLGVDLASDQIRQLRRPDDFESGTILPLRTVLKTADFVRFARAIDSNPTLSDSQKVAYLDRADKVQRSIRDYRIALTIMQDGTVDDAVAIFSRINRSGRRMTADQMAVALTYNEGFNLDEALERMQGALIPFGFGDVSRTVILQALMEGSGQNFTKPKFDDLRKKGTQLQLERATVPVTTALCRSARFLNTKIGFSTGRLLPYALQLLLLSVFFRNRLVDPEKLDHETVRALTSWFWATSFSGWFASANSADIEKAVGAMSVFAVNPTDCASVKSLDAFFKDRPLRPFPKTFDRRSARIRAMLLVQMVRGKLLDPVTNEEIDGSRLMADPDRRDLPYIFRPDGSRPARSPANRILLDRSYGSSVRERFRDLLETADGFLLDDQQRNRLEAALRTHGIDQFALQTLRGGNLSDFVHAREAELQRQENEFLSEYGLTIQSSIERSEDEVDVDEE
jgi:Protein of unknown function DUF262